MLQDSGPEGMIRNASCGHHTHAGNTQHFESQSCCSHKTEEYAENDSVGIMRPQRWLKFQIIRVTTEYSMLTCKRILYHTFVYH